MRRVLDELQPTLDRALTTYVGAQSSPLYRSRAKALAVQAIRSYAPEQGAQLTTHVMNQLHPLTRYARAAAAPVRVPEQRVRQYAELQRATSELEERLGHEPSDGELADNLGISVRRIANVRRAVRPNLLLGGPTAEDQPDDPVVYEADPMDAYLQYVYHDLGEVDRKIMEWRLGYNGRQVLPNIEIARRLRLSPSAVSQRAARIDQTLRQLAGV